MLDINTIARVAVNTVRASASPASFDTGLLLVRDAGFTEDRRLLSFASGADAAEGLAVLGFGTGDGVYRSAVKYFAASPSPGRLLVSCYPPSSSAAEALDAVLDRTSAFYGVTAADPLTGEEWLAFARHVEALSCPLVLFIPVTGTPAGAAAAGSLADRLYTARLKRAVPFFCGEASDCAALMGTAMGLELAHKGSAFALCYKTLNGILPSELSQSQAEILKTLNCNIYVARGYTHLLLENGTTAGGQRYDEVLYIDKIAGDLQNAAVTLLAENPDRLPRRTIPRPSSSTAFPPSSWDMPTRASWPPPCGGVRTSARSGTGR